MSSGVSYVKMAFAAQSTGSTDRQQEARNALTRPVSEEDGVAIRTASDEIVDRKFVAKEQDEDVEIEQVLNKEVFMMALLVREERRLRKNLHGLVLDGRLENESADRVMRSLVWV